jgi:hypothetical protein
VLAYFPIERVPAPPPHERVYIADGASLVVLKAAAYSDRRYLPTSSSHELPDVFNAAFGS